jgi:hypothetical protein
VTDLWVGTEVPCNEIDKQLSEQAHWLKLAMTCENDSGNHHGWMGMHREIGHWDGTSLHGESTRVSKTI